MAGKKLIILMGDDDADDRMFVREAFAGKPVEVWSVEDGLELLDYLLCRGKYNGGGDRYLRPALILLDLNMPSMGDKEALVAIQADSSLRSIQAIILTTSHEECEVKKHHVVGANLYHEICAFKCSDKVLKKVCS